MTIKLDENLPERLVAELSALGHDVDTVRAEQLAGRDDNDVWRGAQSAHRFLITQDLDFSDVRRYAENAPLSLTDPFGLKPAPCFGCAPSQDGGGNGGPDGRGPDVGGGAPGPGGNGGRCGAICQLSRGVTQRAGAMTRPKSYLQLAGISVAGGALGVAAVEAVAGAEVVALGELTEVTFGHGARHLAGTGLNQTAVEAAIRAEVQSIAESASTTGEFWGHSKRVARQFSTKHLRCRMG